FSYEKHDPVSNTGFGLAPRLGFNIPLAPMFSFWPKAGFGFLHVGTSTPAGSASANYLSLFLYAPFLFHPVPHFFIGFGPSLSGNVAGGDSSQHFLTFSLSSVVGGYFDW
ncbi:MAG TPA: hypothetical protein VN914_04145, partial [Polyangia bacterium]|nr:hypothetical protein [Polyangia bacterium]